MFALGSVTEALVLTVRHLTRGVTHATQTQQPWGLRQQVELQTIGFHNHGEGSYWGLLLVESTY